MSDPTPPSSAPGSSGKVQALIVGMVALVAVVTAFSVTLAGRAA
jgi:hypothetical protein